MAPPFLPTYSPTHLPQGKAPVQRLAPNPNPNPNQGKAPVQRLAPNPNPNPNQGKAPVQRLAWLEAQIGGTPGK